METAAFRHSPHGFTVFLLCEIGLVAVVMVFTAAAVRDHYVDLFVQRGQLVAQDLAERGEHLFRLGLLLDEFLGFEEQCHRVVAANDWLSRAQLADNDGRVLYDSLEVRDPQKIVAGPSGKADERLTGNDEFRIRQPVMGMSRHAEGLVFVEVSKAAVDREVRGLMSTIFVFSTLWTAIGLAVVVLFLRRQFWTPIANLLQHIAGIDPDNVDIKPSQPTRRRDEIGIVAQAFDALIQKLAKMQLALRQANEKLTEYAKTLEKEVAARTRELSVANKELERLATTDSLTGLPNRFHFDEMLRQRFEHARRHQRPIALMIIDLDGFKQINDQWGHAAGDMALKMIAQRVKDSLREGDTFFVTVHGPATADAVGAGLRSQKRLLSGPWTRSWSRSKAGAVRLT